MNDEIVFPHSFPCIFQCKHCDHKFKEEVVFTSRIHLKCAKRDIPLKAYYWGRFCPKRCYAGNLHAHARLVYVIEQQEFVFR